MKSVEGPRKDSENYVVESFTGKRKEYFVCEGQIFSFWLDNNSLMFKK